MFKTAFISNQLCFGEGPVIDLFFTASPSSPLDWGQVSVRLLVSWATRKSYTVCMSPDGGILTTSLSVSSSIPK